MADRTYLPAESVRRGAHVSSMQQYLDMYKRSVDDPEGFWGEIAGDFYWVSLPQGKFLDYNFDFRKGPVFVRWMQGARTNVCYNALDRNVQKGLGDTVAYHWEGNDPGISRTVTYGDLLKKVCKCANVLKSKGVKKGHTVAIYMPMTPELVVAMLACARLGAAHSVVFAGYSAESLAERIVDGKCSLLITADGGCRGTKLVRLKEVADDALRICRDRGHHVTSSIIVRHVLSPVKNSCAAPRTVNGVTVRHVAADCEIQWNPEVDCWWHEEMSKASNSCEPEWVDAEDPLFVLYTSGSTGKPKGIVHTTGGYMIYGALTFKYVFDYRPGDVYFCTADIGWLTGHTCIVYGNLLNAATTVLYEGVPCHPDPGRYWAIVEKYRVTQFYTAPTAIRTLMKFGDNYVKRYNRQSLRVLASVGEPINPETWLWYHQVIGDGQCALVDTFWQTETGGHMIAPLPGCTPTKPGSSTLPFFGVDAAIVDNDGREIDGPGKGYLVFRKPWPAIMREVFGNYDRFETAYFRRFPGCYFTGDEARRDEDGYLWVTGRVDDMLNVSGHLMSTSEVESALVEHRAVTETAAVSIPHPIKGECLYCFVVLKEGISLHEDLLQDLRQKVLTRIGSFAVPEYVHVASSLPKTRSGKTMRRVLRSIARNERDLGDLSTLVDEGIVQELLQTRPVKVQLAEK